MHDLKLVLVAAVALVDENGRLLLGQRPEGKNLAGLWEFPGGKVEVGESPEAALVRELHEELGITVEEGALKPFQFASHAYEEFHLLMPVFLCTKWQGEPKGMEGQNIAWVAEQDLDDYPTPPADVDLMTNFVEWVKTHYDRKEDS
jgi:8-oxo-dGTP diphosphatase